jgi:eukaryotic-like serine/threonine-protein kinase
MARRIPGIKPSIPDHTVLEWIGGGSYGDVWLCRNVLGQCRAVKVVHKERFDTEAPFTRAFNGLQTFEPISRSHPGLVNLCCGQTGGCRYPR